MTAVGVHFGHLCRVATTRFVPVDDGANVTVTFRVASNRTRRAQHFSRTVPLSPDHNSVMIGSAWDQMMADATIRDTIVRFVVDELDRPTPNQSFDVITANLVSITFHAPSLNLMMGENVSMPLVATSGSSHMSTVLTGGQVPAGLSLVDDRLVGTIESIRDYRFTIKSKVSDYPEEVGAGEQTFTQDVGVTGIGGAFGFPDGVTATEAAVSHGGLTPDHLFRDTSGYWHSQAGNGGLRSFDVAFPEQTVMTHVRIWSHSHPSSQNITRLEIHGDGVLIGNYGAEARPPYDSTWSDHNQWAADWSELAPSATLAIEQPGAYSVYTFAFPDLVNKNYVSMGRMQLLNVPGGANVPPGLFL